MAGRETAPTDATTEATAWIDAYLAALPTDQRTALQALRETIAAAAPDAAEGISYGIPAFRYRGRPLVWYLAAKAHCSFFPGVALDPHRGDLEGYDVAKGTIRFTPGHPLPANLVGRLVQERIARLTAAAARKR